MKKYSKGKIKKLKKKIIIIIVILQVKYHHPFHLSMFKFQY